MASLASNCKRHVFGKVCPEFNTARIRLQISERYTKHVFPLAMMGSISLDSSKWTSSSFLHSICCKVKMVRVDQHFG
jgi:hypothetical protein